MLSPGENNAYLRRNKHLEVVIFLSVSEYFLRKTSLECRNSSTLSEIPTVKKAKLILCDRHWLLFIYDWIYFILAVNNDMHNGLDKVESKRDPTTD